MSETPQNPPAPPTTNAQDAPIFGARPQDRGGLSPAVWGIAALVVLIVAGAFLFATRHKGAPSPSTLQPPDAYAASLRITNLAMSEAENLSGGKVTYVDGHIQNTGSKTVTGATVQVVFANDEAMPPTIQTVPLTLIRTTQPYVDTEPISAEPLKPGDGHDFRLIFDSIPENWNQQMPEVRIIQTDLK